MTGDGPDREGGARCATVWENCTGRLNSIHPDGSSHVCMIVGQHLYHKCKCGAIKRNSQPGRLAKLEKAARRIEQHFQDNGDIGFESALRIMKEELGLPGPSPSAQPRKEKV